MPNIQPIEMTSIFTPYTLDTYNTFTFDNAEEALIEDPHTYDSYNWKYDVNGYLLALAKNSLKLQQENIIDDVITAVASDLQVIRPREYNFRTDEMFLSYTVDLDKLNAFIDANKVHYEDNRLQSRDGFRWYGTEEQTRLAYYLEYKSAVHDLTSDEYITTQYEQVEPLDFVTATLKADALAPETNVTTQ